MNPLKGIHYRSPFVYRFLTWLKLGAGSSLRFRIAAEYAAGHVSVLDICAGDGGLRRFLPASCEYHGIEASPSFASRLSRQGIPCDRRDLHDGLGRIGRSYDLVVMLISLCHFRETSAHRLLEEFKTTARRVLIVEDVLDKPRPVGSPVQRIMNYLCALDYFRPMQLYTRGEFFELMRGHGYSCFPYNQRYWIGYYEPEQDS
ncbi:MAG: class I SAM-dependent methyltransferase [Candidatus Omnitrophota bacterium]|nr:class I SAM-dependent methyltransferase [Candidatus Omnitrophota bacterium]MDZ4242989.1 class I SAM-dependent methyltransferase [Candidatus Omnitrophota bacterium]